MYRHLLESGVEIDDIEKLKQFINDEQFESDTFEFDLDCGSDTYKSNISNHIQNKQCVEKIIHFIQRVQMSALSFSIGLRFYYWPYYQTIKQIPDEEQLTGNQNDHS
eukprot:14146_1